MAEEAVHLTNRILAEQENEDAAEEHRDPRSGATTKPSDSSIMSITSDSDGSGKAATKPGEPGPPEQDTIRTDTPSTAPTAKEHASTTSDSDKINEAVAHPSEQGTDDDLRGQSSPTRAVPSIHSNSAEGITEAGAMPGAATSYRHNQGGQSRQEGHWQEAGNPSACPGLMECVLSACPPAAGWSVTATREIFGETIRVSYSFRASGGHQADRVYPGEVPPPPQPLHQGDMYGTTPPSLFYQPPRGPAPLPRLKTGRRAAQALKFVPSPSPRPEPSSSPATGMSELHQAFKNRHKLKPTRAPPRPPGVTPRPVTGRRTFHQVPVPLPRLGQATPPHRFLRPVNRDSPDPRQLHNPGTPAASAEEKDESSSGGTLVALDPAADSRMSSPASAEGPPKKNSQLFYQYPPRSPSRTSPGIHRQGFADLHQGLQTVASPGCHADLSRPSPVPAGLLKMPFVAKTLT